MEEKLTVDRTALLLGVSPATVRNWRRAGMLTSLTRKSVDEFLIKRKGEDRLISRANKSGSRRIFSPGEYGKIAMGPILALIEEQGWSRERALFFAMEDLTGPYGEKPDNPHFDAEMARWGKALFPRGKIGNRPPFPEIIAGVEDFPGRLFQSLAREGEKSRRGSYFTPPELADQILAEVLPRNGQGTYWDPCCGTGMFLCRAARLLGDPTRVFGQDIDPLAVRLSRLNLMRQFPRLPFEPSVHGGDSLKGLNRAVKIRRFDAIATNPPWGYRFSPDARRELERKYPLQSGESASAFILAALPLLAPEGRAGFLLPESLLHRERHGDIRRALLERAESIRWFGNPFTRVQSESFALFLGSGRGETIPVKGLGTPYDCSREDFRSAPLGVWNIFTRPEERGIFARLFQREHRPLGEGSLWGLGIVTGNNREQLFEAEEAPGESEPILTGTELTPFCIAPPRYRLRYGDGKLQQKAPRELYGRGKILYRFIAPSPVAALDREGLLTLNSVNFLIPPGDIPPEIPVMLLNSRLYRLYFERTFHTLKILRRQLETLPLPHMTEEETAAFLELYPLLERDYPAHREALDRLVYNLFAITPKERETLESTL